MLYLAVSDGEIILFLVSLLISDKEMDRKEEEIQNSLLKIIISLFLLLLFYFLPSVEILAQLDRKYASFLNIEFVSLSLLYILSYELLARFA